MSPASDNNPLALEKNVSTWSVVKPFLVKIWPTELCTCPQFAASDPTSVCDTRQIEVLQINDQ
jgi:hypothetical protein